MDLFHHFVHHVGVWSGHGLHADGVVATNGNATHDDNASFVALKRRLVRHE